MVKRLYLESLFYADSVAIANPALQTGWGLRPDLSTVEKFVTLG